MKIVDLNRRYLAYRRYQHQVALRFDSYWQVKSGPQAVDIERSARELLGPDTSLRYGETARWCSYFGSHARTVDPLHRYKPYWITFQTRQDLMMVLLAVG